MRIEECSFCSCPVYPGHGIKFIRNDATVFTFCRSKCNKAFKRKWNPRRTKWTKAYRLFKGKEVPGVRGLGVKRDEIIRYKRDIVRSTVDSIPIINEIESEKRKNYIYNRIMETREKNKASDMNVLKKYGHLLTEDTVNDRKPQKSEGVSRDQQS